MLGVRVGVAVFAHLPLFKLVGEVGGRADRFGVTLHAHRLLDIRLCNAGVECAGSKRRVLSMGLVGQMPIQGKKEPAAPPK